MVRQFGYSKSTIILKINRLKLINNHPKIKNSSLSLNVLEIYLKVIKEICEESAIEFE